MPKAQIFLGHRSLCKCWAPGIWDHQRLEKIFQGGRFSVTGVNLIPGDTKVVFSVMFCPIFLEIMNHDHPMQAGYETFAPNPR